ncbi:MAG: carbon storage regulator [Planctomycetales bacterium]|nr:carbon storage regulator [bacterium]UNM09556.1 MAG: carbon storage regulator [Planctomycetales bacterium]
MLVLTRKPGEKIMLGPTYEVEVLSVERGVVRFSFSVDRPVSLMPGNVQIDAMPGGDDGAMSPIRLTRKVDDSVVIELDGLDQIEVLVVSVKGESVRVGVKAPRHVQIHRHEIYELIQGENIAASRPAEIDAAGIQELLRRQRVETDGDGE